MLKQKGLCLIAVLFASLLFAITGLAQQPLAPQNIDLSSLVDQFGQPFRGQDSMVLVMVVNGMKAKNMVRDTLADLDISCLKQGRVIYLANISGMPKMISKLIAVPRMRKLGYPVWLDYSGSVTETWLTRKDVITLLAFDSEQAVTAVDYAASGGELRAKLMPECGLLGSAQGG